MRTRQLLTLLALAVLLVACDNQGTAVVEPTAEDAATDPGTVQSEADAQADPGPAADPEAAPGEDERTRAPVADDAVAASVEVQVSTVATGLSAPWALAFTGDDRVLLTERDTGAVLELLADGSTREIHRFEVDAAGEGGLLGLAVSPEDELYAYMTTASDNRVVRFTPGGVEDVVLDGIPSASNHNGGRIAFGPDGMLYIATGDAGQGARAQDPDSLAGKILRLTPDGAVPDDNPTAGSAVYALGFRNVQGLAWDADGVLYASEFGPDRDDEINRIEPGGNYGWPEVTADAGVAEFIDPIFVRQPPEASWSGIAVLVDGAIPQWEGQMFAAALRGSRLWRLELGGQGDVADSEELLVEEHGRLRLAAQAPDGSLWVLTNNRDGRGDPREGDDRILRLGPAEQ